MEATLSVVFHDETVMCALFEPGAKGWQVVDVASFSGWYDVLTNEFDKSSVGYKLLQYIQSIAQRIKDVRVVLPASAVLSQFIPFIPSNDQKHIMDLLELELMQSAPETSIPSYRATFYPLRSLRGAGALMLAVLNRKTAEQNLRELFAGVGVLDCEFVVRHVAAHAAFMYSYPERASETAIMINIDKTRCDVSVLQKRSTVFFNMIPYAEGETVADRVVHEIEDNIIPCLESTPSVVLYGDSLTPALVSLLELRLGESVSSVQRCNAFRMCTAVLDDEHRVFASRMAHRFAANVGSVLQRRSVVPAQQ